MAKDVLPRLASRISEDDIKNIVLELLEDPRITFTNVEPKISFEEAPAAPKAHHSYPGGLIDHTAGVTRIAMTLACELGTTYGIEADLDTVIAAALLHDLFKYYQYEKDPVTGGFRARQDWYLAHDFTLVAELTKRGAPEKLIRACAEVHGVYGNSLEGKIVHVADSADVKISSQLQDIVYGACIDIERETDGRFLAVKLFHQVVKKRPLFDLAAIGMIKGRDALREEIKRLLGL